MRPPPIFLLSFYFNLALDFRTKQNKENYMFRISNLHTNNNRPKLLLGIIYWYEFLRKGLELFFI